MKKFVPNQLFNHSGSELLTEKLTRPMLQKLLLILIVAGYSVNSNAQQARTTPAIQHVDQFLSTMRAQNQNNISNAERLLKDVQPAVYYFGGEVKSYGNNPSCLYTDVVSMNSIPASIPTSGIEMITVKAKGSELAGGLDLSVFSTFPNLKYIYILSDKDATSQDIINSIQNHNPAYRVFYEIVSNN